MHDRPPTVSTATGQPETPVTETLPPFYETSGQLTSVGSPEYPGTLPSIAEANRIPTHDTFESAQRAKRPLSDQVIEAAINHTPLRVLGNSLGLKGYLESATVTASDRMLAHDVIRVGALHASTARVVAGNLKVMHTSNSSQQATLEKAVKNYGTALVQRLPLAVHALSNWCAQRGEYPAEDMEFRGSIIPGVDVLNANASDSEYSANIRFNRTPFGTDVTAVSDALQYRLCNQLDARLSRSIFLNPQADTTAAVFEALLRIANREGLAVRLDMVDRAHEFSMIYRNHTQGRTIDVVRGNAITIHTSESEANRMLGHALSIAQDHPGIFAARRTGRLPQYVADGIAVADRPVGTDDLLVDHREELLSEAGERIKMSAVKSEEQKAAYRETFGHFASKWHVDPDNLAFNRR